MKRHTIITGTGRAGTTFLVQLFTALGLDTGYSIDSPVDPIAHAGLEWDLLDPAAPYVVKSPALCDRLELAMQTGMIAIDWAIVPVRDLYAAAESRREVERQNPAPYPPGGVWDALPELQELALAEKLCNLLRTIAAYQIPLIVLDFPRTVSDREYLYIRLLPVLRGIGYKQFDRAFEMVVRPELVHSFES